MVVTFESALGIEDPDVVFNYMLEALASDLGATDVRVTEGTLCGLPAETIHYQMPVMGNARRTRRRRSPRFSIPTT